MMIRILLAIVIVAAAVMAGVNINGYLNQSLAKDAIKEQIANAGKNLAVLEEKTEQLNAEVAGHSRSAETTRAAIAAAQSEVPSVQIDTNEIVRQILNLGRDRGVNVNLMTTQEWTSLKNEGYDCRATALNLEAAGDKQDMVSFIKQLPDLYNTLVIDKLTVSRVKQGPDTATATDRITAYLTLMIYSR